VAVDQVHAFETAYLDYLRTSQPELLERIRNEKALSDELVEALTKVTRNFLSTNTFGDAPAVQAAD
jgi:F-type H+-transporting ATPase subunit alpha